jgi:prevent-host-death family protein
MRSIKASEFKAKCLRLIDEVAATGEPIEITKRGKPVARLVMQPAVVQEDNLAKFRRLFPVSVIQTTGLRDDWKTEIRKEYGDLDSKWNARLTKNAGEETEKS